MLIVQKFGGSSLASPERVRRSAAFIAEAHRAGHSVAAVLSAQGDSTDELLARAKHMTPHPSPRELDMLLSTGEQASVALMAMALEDMGLPAVSLTGWQAGIGTDEAFTAARIRRIDTRRLRKELDAGRIVLAAGFQGLSPEEDITTLGRGGSDTTAVALACALRADRCRIYTDVEGVYTADPRLVPGARKLQELDTEEMLRLARRGSQVLHDRAAELARKNGMELEVLSSFVRAPGTVIRPLPAESPRVTALTRSGDTVSLVGSLLTRREELPGEMRHVLRREGIRPGKMLAGDGSISVQVGEENTVPALRCLHALLFEEASGS